MLMGPVWALQGMVSRCLCTQYAQGSGCWDQAQPSCSTQLLKLIRAT